MSYILDALKRADAERQRGTVPSLHARQVTSPALPAASGAKNRLWLAAGAVLALGASASGVWFWRTQAQDARTAAAAPALASPGPVASRPLAQPVPAPTTPASIAASITPPPPQAAAEPAPRQQRAALPPPSAAPAPKPAPPKPQAAAKAAAPGAITPALQTPAPVARAAASRAASADAPRLSELPEDIRRQIPAMALNGVVYSENPAQRMLLVNQQVLTQGSLAVPEVRLEEIRERSSVFSFRGTRFRLAH